MGWGSTVITEDQYTRYFECLIRGQRQTCQEIVQSYLDAGIAVRELYTALFQRSLYEVGALWSRNQLSVATEHLATSITEQLLTLVYPKLFAVERKGQSVVVSCVANEYHQVGAKMVADVFELHGWDSFFLGANTPLKDLLDLIESKQPTVVGLSLCVYFNLTHLLEAIHAVRAHQPRVPIWVGGHAFEVGGVKALDAFDSIIYIDSIAQLESQIRSYAN